MLNTPNNVWLCVTAGSIIRCMRRLEEVLRQMSSAAKAIGNTELENKFTEGRKPCSAVYKCKSVLHNLEDTTHSHY